MTPHETPSARHARHVAHLRAAGARVLAVVRDPAADLAAPVHACQRWDVADVVRHLEEVHRWATIAVRENRDAPDAPWVDRDPAVLAPAYAATLDALAAALEEAGPAAPCWHFGPEPHEAAFWSRRQALEAWVHAWDVVTATGGDVAVPADLAADGVEEVVTMFFPRQVRLGRTEPLAASLALECTDAPGSPRWLLSGDGTSGGDTPDAVVSGPASALLLLLWQRRGLDGGPPTGAGDGAPAVLSCEGDEAAARTVLGSALTP